MRQLSANEVWIRVVYLMVTALAVLAILPSIGVSLTRTLWVVLVETMLQVFIYSIDDRKKGDK